MASPEPARGHRGAGIHATAEAAARGAFGRACALLFAASAVATVALAASMSAMGAMPMRGGWTMSMAWLPMCAQAWPGPAASFVAMWSAMTVAMMLPSVAPTLWRYRCAIGRSGARHPMRLTVLVGVGYFLVWLGVGIAAWAAGVTLAALAMPWPAIARAVPVAIGGAVLLAGAFQLTAWKARRLACCREAPRAGRAPVLRAEDAWRHGLRLGTHCVASCAGLTAVMLVLGVMDLRVMAAVSVAITAERCAPAGARVARASGCVALGLGSWLLASAVLGAA